MQYKPNHKWILWLSIQQIMFDACNCCLFLITTGLTLHGAHNLSFFFSIPLLFFEYCFFCSRCRQSISVGGGGTRQKYFTSKTNNRTRNVFKTNQQTKTKDVEYHISLLIVWFQNLGQIELRYHILGKHDIDIIMSVKPG